MTYSITEIQTIKLTAKRQQLQAPEEFWLTSANNLQTILNGYGPDSWSESARDALTWIYRNYQESAAIHDVRYDMATGQEVDRVVADNEFLENLKTQWSYKYGWTRWGNPVAIYGYIKINLAYKAVELFGSKNYNKQEGEK